MSKALTAVPAGREYASELLAWLRREFSRARNAGPIVNVELNWFDVLNRARGEAISSWDIPAERSEYYLEDLEKELLDTAEVDSRFYVGEQCYMVRLFAESDRRNHVAVFPLTIQGKQPSHEQMRLAIGTEKGERAQMQSAFGKLIDGFIRMTQNVTQAHELLRAENERLSERNKGLENQHWEVIQQREELQSQRHLRKLAATEAKFRLAKWDEALDLGRRALPAIVHALGGDEFVDEVKGETAIDSLAERLAGDDKAMEEFLTKASELPLNPDEFAGVLRLIKGKVKAANDKKAKQQAQPKKE
jgi:hypothetical protein